MYMCIMYVHCVYIHVHTACVYPNIQIDSWWYFTGPDNGVKNWTAMPSVFPNGIDTVARKTGMPIEAHNRWWYV